MWLLSTDRAELHYFPQSCDADGGYAILSHTWDGNEQTFQDVQAIGERCRANGTNPRDDTELSEKISKCCELAEKDGYRWVWVDSCCINKKSSSELSEAINSMYKWYKSSEVCYAYLKDVPSDDDVSKRGSAFWKSRWHTRGWTLQELIAPDFVIFLSGDWKTLGDRVSLASVLHQITRVQSEVLDGTYPPANVPVSIRMSWASKRHTTREEDEAYSLMGLFGVNMLTNYGEGRRAFIRLQKEIMRDNSDMSLFAFGRHIDLDDINHHLVFGGWDKTFIDFQNPWQYLLADSPRHFVRPYAYIPDIVQTAAPPVRSHEDQMAPSPFDADELPTATMTNYGIQLRAPVADVGDTTIALIFCECATTEQHVGLFLMKDPREKTDPLRPRYFTGYPYSEPGESSKSIARMCDLGKDASRLTFKEVPVKASWRTIYIIPTPSHLHFEQAVSPNLSINRHPMSFYRIPRWFVNQLIALGFEVGETMTIDDNPTVQVIHLSHRFKGHMCIFLGLCTKGQHPRPWAKIYIPPSALYTPSHECFEDHLDSNSWASGSKDFKFKNPDRTVRLSLQPLMRMLDSRYIVHLQLGEPFFQKMLEDAGIKWLSLPTE